MTFMACFTKSAIAVAAAFHWHSIRSTRINTFTALIERQITRVPTTPLRHIAILEDFNRCDRHSAFNLQRRASKALRFMNWTEAVFGAATTSTTTAI